MVTNNFRLGIKDSVLQTCSDGYTNIYGVKQYFNPIESYRTQYPKASYLSIHPWIFSSIYFGNESSITVDATGSFNKEALQWLFPTTCTGTFYANTPFLLFGSGTTPANSSDYMLESPICASFKYSKVRSIGITDDAKNYINWTLLITSQEANPITISEIGLFAVCYTKATAPTTEVSFFTTYNSSNSSRYEFYMIEHTILDTPITLANNESASINYRITSDVTF